VPLLNSYLEGVIGLTRHHENSEGFAFWGRRFIRNLEDSLENRADRGVRLIVVECAPL
jgi:hypothetical protein